MRGFLGSHSSQHLTLLLDAPGVVAIDKPAELAAIPGRGETDSVLQRLSEQLGQKMLVVHRLDKQTSGVMVFARNREAQRHLSHQFQNNTVQKEYLALVSGRAPADQGEIDGPIGVHPANKLKMAVLKHGGRPARTGWEVEQRFRDFTLLRVFPRTGKTHQIRVHLSHVGLPLAIDPLYAGARESILLSQLKRNYRPKPGEPERPLIARLTLHAHRLTFHDPSGASQTVEAPLPRDLRATLNQLSRLQKIG